MILVVDDEPAVRDLLREILERNGYRVWCAADGIEALELIAQQQPALVLSDVSMPRMDGCSLVARLRMAGNGVPVLLITAGLSVPPCPSVRIVRKPFNPEVLLRTIAEMLTPEPTSAF